MTKPRSVLFLASEVSIVAGIALGAAAICGYFEPQYSCNIAKSTETIAAQIAAAAMIFGACLVMHIKNKALKSYEAARTTQLNMDVPHAPPTPHG